MFGLTKFEKAYYEIISELSLIKATKNEFQNLFADVMEYRYPSNFLRSTPWGQWGDQKCDGYLQSTRRVYAVYAPHEMRDGKKAIEKVQADYDGAVLRWRDYCDEWFFIHNAGSRGLGPHMIKLLERLKAQEDGIQVEWMGINGLLDEIRLLPPPALQALFGHAPTERDMLAVDFVDIQHVLQFIEGSAPESQSDLRQPPPNKIKRNELSEDVEQFLRMGMKKARYVGNFFEQYHDPQYGSRIATTFHRKYIELREDNLHPDEIFMQLWAFAGGATRNSPAKEMAVLSILAHLFEFCDIFEGE